MSFGSDTPGGSVEGIGGNESGIGGGGFGGGDNYSGGWEAQVREGYGSLAGRPGGFFEDPYNRDAIRELERRFQWEADPLMSFAYGPIGNALTKLSNFGFNKTIGSIVPGLGLANTLSGLLGGPTAGGWARDQMVSRELADIMGVSNPSAIQGGVSGVIEEAARQGKSEQEIGNAFDTVSKRRGGVMGLWEDLTGKSSARAATGAAGTEASYQQQAIDYLKQMGAYPYAAQQRLAGVYGLPGGEGTQQQLIDQVRTSPMYSTMMQSGEDAILRQAGATGGLRSGNVQDALARYSGDVMSQLYGQQLSGLTGLAGLGTYAPQIAQGYGNIGSALAGGQLSADLARQYGSKNIIDIGGSVLKGLGGIQGIASGLGGMWSAGKTGFETGGVLGAIGGAIGSLF